MSVCVLTLSRIIKNKEVLSEIMQDFKYDSEECDWQVDPWRLATTLWHHQTAGLINWLGAAATSISAALIDPLLAPPCLLQQSYSTQGTFHILAPCVFICSLVLVLMHTSAKMAYLVMELIMCKYCSSYCKKLIQISLLTWYVVFFK